MHVWWQFVANGIDLTMASVAAYYFVKEFDMYQVRCVCVPVHVQHTYIQEFDMYQVRCVCVCLCIFNIHT